IANPPYGVRVGETQGLRDLFARLGQLVRAHGAGWRVALLSADRQLERETRLPFTEVLATRNGGIPVRLVVG
ncbi:MAG: class I SAM-dependent RNA methyltransferase, partial [Gemmatimonadota bacterium]